MVRAKQAPSVECHDTGSLRGDLVSTYCGSARHGQQRGATAVLGSVITALAATRSSPSCSARPSSRPRSRSPARSTPVRIERGEIPPDLDIDIIAPALAGILLHRSFVLGRSPTTTTVAARHRPRHPPGRGLTPRPRTTRPEPETEESQDVMTDTTTAPPNEEVTAAPKSSGPTRLGWALVLISIAQLMVVLDSTIANIALPYIKADLGFSDSGLTWVVTGYALAFGGLLLLGGRLGDLYGRRKIFMTGLVVFALASLLGGIAASEADAARRSWPPGRRRRARLPRCAGADHHDLPGRSGAQPRLRRVRRHVRRRRGRRPDPRWLADRLEPRALRDHHRRLAADVPDQRADRHHRRVAGSPRLRGVRVAPRRARRTRVH